MKTAEAAVAGYQERLAALERSWIPPRPERKGQGGSEAAEGQPGTAGRSDGKDPKGGGSHRCGGCRRESGGKAEKLEDARARAEKRAAEAAQALEEAQKQRALGSPEAAVFRVLFGKVQEDFQQMGNVLSQVQLQDPELAEKLRAAVRKLLENLEEGQWIIHR